MQPLRVRFGDLCRVTRVRLDITQRELADAAGISRGYLANIESARANATLDQVDRISVALGLELSLDARMPTFLRERRGGDLVHARCVAYVEARLVAAGWLVAREVEIVDGRTHGWIDLLAFDPATGRLLVIEVKTRLDDLGAIERHLGWYARRVSTACERLGWHATRTAPWIVALASDEVDRAVGDGRVMLARAFPARAAEMLEVVRAAADARAGLAMVDPYSRRYDWLIRSRADGRRTAPPFVGYADAAERLHVGRTAVPGATIGR